MVTGVETAGLVLAVLPLLIQALSVYKSGFEKTGLVLGLRQKKYKIKVNRLIIKLQGLSTSLQISIFKLIARAAPDETLVGLPGNYKDKIWTGQVAEKIKAYLGLSNVFEVFQDTLSMCEVYLEEIAQNIEGIVQPAKVSCLEQACWY